MVVGENAEPVAAITGASGFIGQRLAARLASDGIGVRRLSRCRSFSDVDVSFDDFESLVAALVGVDVVFHCAGRAHAFDEAGGDALHAYANETVTLNTARAAALAGVRRFVFLSTVKAAGDPGEQCADESFGEPADSPYGRSKRSAEVGLQMISSQTRLQTVSLRLAMVYGSGGRGNLERMMQAVAAGWFPPLPETNNRRSLVHVEDVLDAMQMAAVHPGASGKIYIVAHPDCVSGRQLYTLMCEALGKRVPDVAVPEWLLRSIGRAGDIGGKLLGKRFPLDGQVVSRLLDSSWYSSELLTRELGWRAQVDLRVGLHSIAEGLGSK